MALVALVMLIWLSLPEQDSDPSFDARVEHPAHTTSHPRVYFDEGHWNVHKANGRYKPFADLIRNDGYLVESKSRSLTREGLAGYQVLVIANALGFKGAMNQLATLAHLDRKIHFRGDAFTADECIAVREWVRAGGSLLLISDHAPTGEAAGRLSREFGVTMRNGWAEEPKSHDPETGNWGFLVFSRENGQLLDHPVTRGRDNTERLNKVMTFTGQALDYSPGATPFLKLSPEAREYPYARSADNEFRPAADAAQGVALEFGNGRVVVLGEAAALTSQIARAPGLTFYFGMRHAGTDNRQLALNIMHWLSRALN